MKCGDHGGLTSQGAPCKREVAAGLTRCNLHGATAGAKIKAELMLAQSRLPVCEALYSIVDQFLTATCPTCNYPSGDPEAQRTIIRAAQVILDRTGMGPTSKVEVTPQSEGSVPLDLLTNDERAELIGLLARVKEIKDAVRARAVAAVEPI
jgi:hypothetical protein